MTDRQNLVHALDEAVYVLGRVVAAKSEGSQREQLAEWREVLKAHRATLAKRPEVLVSAINGLPEPVKHYIYWLETDADPAGTLQDNWRLLQENRALRALVGELRTDPTTYRRPQLRNVMQQHPRSCGIAAVAIVSERSYEEVHAMFPDNADGVGSDGLHAMLTACGVWYDRRLDASICAGEIGIVTVPSLNIPGGMHYVVLQVPPSPDGQPVPASKIVVYDPNRGREGRKCYGSEPGDQELLSWAEPVSIRGVLNR